PVALGEERPPDRRRHHAPGHRPDLRLPRAAEAEHPPLVAGADPGRLAVLGLAAGPRGVVRPRHPQGTARPQPRPLRAPLGAPLVQALAARAPALAPDHPPPSPRPLRP